jgi:tRNA modification GTPase
LLDSAGLRLTSEKIEKEGIKKTRHMLQQADCILWVSSPDYPGPSPELYKDPKNVRTRVLHLWNKSDLSLPGPSFPPYDHLVSARTRKGLIPLVRQIETLANEFYSQDSHCERGALDSDRQFELLSHLLRLIKPVPNFLCNEQFDLALATLEEGRRVLDDGVGMVPSSDIYDRVFRMFCLGK